jgi:GAF domain-containing protein
LLHKKAKRHFTQTDKERGIELLASKLSKLVPTAEQLAAAPQETRTTTLDEKQKEFPLGEFARSLDAEGGSLFLLEQDRFVLTQSLDPGHAPAIIPLPLRKGSVFERTIDTKEPLLVRDIGKDADMKSSGWTGYADRSSLAFPIIGRGDGIAGIISLHNRRSGPFTEEDRERGAELLASLWSGKTRRHWLSRKLQYPVTIICAAILAGLVFLFLLKIGF